MKATRLTMTPAELRQWRAKVNWTQKQAATMLGVSHRAIVAWEGGTNRVPTAVVYACRYLQDRHNLAGLAIPARPRMGRPRSTSPQVEAGE